MAPASLALYRAATALLEPFAPVLLRRRAAGGKEDPARLGERLGKPSQAVPEGPLVWLHGVSVGESLSLLPLIEAIRDRSPETRLLVTSGTRTSAELLAKRLPSDVIHQYAPIDGPRAVARFLNHWRPRLGVFVESELWPNMILAAKARRVRLALLSARMTEDSARGWGRVPAAARALLSAFDLVLPQEAETAGRLSRLGARIGPFLSLKQAGGPLPCDAAELERLRAAIGDRPVILAASTHPGEEEIVARAFQAAGREALLVIAPRHPERAAEIAASLTAQGFEVTRRSAVAPPGRGIYLADTLGEMGLFFRLARAAIMCGSFLPGIGGHNPLEPARLGIAAVTGPHAFNARTTYDEMFAVVAAIEAADAAALSRHIAGLIDNPAIARRIGEAGLDYAQRQGAALDQTLTLIDPLLRP